MTLAEGRKDAKGPGKETTIALSDDVLEWICRSRERLDPSAFVDRILRERMEVGEPCDICERLVRIEGRMEAIEKALAGHAKLRATGSGRARAIAKASTRPADVFGELVHIKNVSAENARSVLEELVPFMRKKKVVYRDLVLRELFPRTRSTITNDINYWYNACRGVLDDLIERGYVVKVEKGKYQWVGEGKPLTE